MIDSLLSLDQSLFLFLNSLHVSWLDSVMLFLSGKLLWLLLFIAALYLGFQKFDKKSFALFVLFLFMALVASDVTSSYILKNTFYRFRPCRVMELKALIYSFGQKCGGKYGFVSSHASNSLALVLFSLRSLNFKSHWSYSWLILPVAISYSRVYLGSHYPGDILGGFIIGIFWSYFFSWSFKNSFLKGPALKDSNH